MLHLRVLRFALFSTAPMMLTESLHIREFLGLLRLKQRVMRLPKVSVFMVIREIRLSATNFPLTLHIKEIKQITVRTYLSLVLQAEMTGNRR